MTHLELCNLLWVCGEVVSVCMLKNSPMYITDKVSRGEINILRRTDGIHNALVVAKIGVFFF